VQLSGVTEICLTKLDILSSLEEIKVCTHYELDGKTVRYADVDSYGLDQVQPIYQTLPGWDEHISDVRAYEDLPEKAQGYVQLIETATGIPVKWIGVGPEREATILR
jgi:adenylosuccinate synthase